MVDFAAILRTHIDYGIWANRKMMDAAATLSEEELTRDFGTADKSVSGTLAHIFGGDRAWLARFENTPRPTFLDPEERSLATLQKQWPIIQQGWTRWAAGMTEESVMKLVSYVDFRGNPWTQPAWQIVLHVVNHGTQHRGQISGFLRAMGHVPPAIDLHVYHRSINAL